MAAATAGRGELHTWAFPGVCLGLQVSHGDACSDLRNGHLCLCHGFLTTPDGIVDQPQGANHAATLLDLYLKDRWRNLAGLDGQFSAVLYRLGSEQVEVLRDIHGLRPLRLRVDPDGAWVATDPKQILAVAAGSLPPDEEYWVRHLLFDPAGQDPDRTFWRGVHRVPPATHSVLDGKGLGHRRRYWVPAEVETLRGHSAEDLSRLWVSAVRRAVRRVFPDGPFSISVSGGLDSSSLLTIAVQELGEQGRLGDVHPFHIAYQGWECDETTFVADLEAALGVPITKFDARELDFADKLPEYLPTGAHPLGRGAEQSEIWRRALEQSATLCTLTGFGGDEYLTEPSTVLADLLRAGRIPAFVRYSRAFHARYRRLPARERWRLWLSRSLVPTGSRMRAAMTTLRLSSPWTPPDWLHPDWTRRAARWRKWADARGAELGYGRSWPLTHYQAWASGVVLDAFDAMLPAFGLELRHPLFAREVAELAFATPPEMRGLSTRPRPRLIAAAGDMLPSSIANRLDKVDFGVLAERHSRVADPDSDGPWELQRMGLLAPGIGSSTQAAVVLPEKLVVAEHWLRALRQRGGA